MNNSKLFTDAHKMTKLTIQPSETYRYKFGQWLIFLKTGVTNVLRVTNINQSVCYVPILEHDRQTTKTFSLHKVLLSFVLSFVLSLLNSRLFILLIIIIQFILILNFV